MTRKDEKTAGSAESVGNASESPKKPFLHSSFYDVSDIREAEKTAYNTEMSADELREQRKKDWLFLLIGVPAFIALIYLIVLISR